MEHKNFFTSAYDFSFKDLLAILLLLPFFLMIYMTIWKLFYHIDISSDLELIKVYLPIIMIVVGGYFGAEMTQSYFMSKSTNPYGNMYGNYGMYDYNNINSNLNNNSSANTTDEGAAEG